MNLIAAVDKNRGIGKEGRMLYHLPEDLRYFKEKTIHKVVVMGRKTLESLPGKQPLPDRVNIVLTRDRSFSCPGAVVARSGEELVEALKPFPSGDIFIIGGGELYRKFLDRCDKAYITRIEEQRGADTFFPDLDAAGDWELSSCSEEKEYQGIKYRFCLYTRKG